MDSLVQAAVKYRGYGLSVVPVTRDKNPIGPWREFQSRIMSQEEIVNAFSKRSVQGIAIVCGAVSGHFEALDLDSRNDPSGTLMYEFSTALRDAHSTLFDCLVRTISRNNGHHFYYRSETGDSNLVLARRIITPQDKHLDPEIRPKVLIETRSNGGIIVVPPTPGYRFLRNDLSKVPILHPNERQIIFDVARAYNQAGESSALVPALATHFHSEDESPLYDYDHKSNHYTIRILLETHGWKFIRTVLPRSFYKRPGRTDQKTSGNFHHDLNRFKTFSTNTDFIAGKAYRPHAVYAVLECQGNFKLAARQLLKIGFGKAYNLRV